MELLYLQIVYLISSFVLTSAAALAPILIVWGRTKQYVEENDNVMVQLLICNIFTFKIDLFPPFKCM